MFYHINPNYRYRFFSPSPFDRPDPFDEDAPAVDVKSTNEPSKRNLVGALKALYKAYGGDEEVKNNAVDIIYKLADVINGKNNTPDIFGEDTKD